MGAFLITWNPAVWEWEDYTECVEQSQLGRGVGEGWSTGRSRRIVAGDRLFMLKLGKAPSGIIASGYATSDASEGAHWNPDKAAQGKTQFYVDIEWEVLLDYETEPILLREVLQTAIPDAHWTPQSSGTLLTDESTWELEQLWSDHFASFRSPAMQLLSDELPTAGTFNEGARSQVLVNRFERNRAARTACIAHFGARCQVCGFDFERMYGSIGQGFIHTHHLVPLSKIDEEYEIDPIEDLTPVCANCHAMIHVRRVPYSVLEMKHVMKAAKSSSK